MRIVIFTLILTFSINVSAELLDKVLAAMNDKVVTLSQVSRVENTITARKNIAPQIYNKTDFTQKEILELIIQRFLIREKLQEIGYITTDEQVESQIKSIEKRLGLKRHDLLNFLKNNGISFDEYFELTRQSIESSYFTNRIIQPLISVSEQEIKNTFYKRYQNKKTLNFVYHLVDFSLPKNKLPKSKFNHFHNFLKEFQATGVMGSSFNGTDINNLGNVSEDGLSTDIKNILKNTDEGSFTSPILLGNYYHVFFIKEKNLAESNQYKVEKDKIKMELIQQSINSVSQQWFVNQRAKHYIKYF